MTASNPSLQTLKHYKHDRKNTNVPNWKEKLRECCYRRVREDRSSLLWKMRLTGDRTSSQKELIKSACENIVADELNKMNSLSSSEMEVRKSVFKADDMIWEYDGIHTAYEGECEEILLEMQRIFYEDLKAEPSRGEDRLSEAYEDEQDDYLAHALYEYMQLNDVKGQKKQIWCPICKKAELQENQRFIWCSLCDFPLNKGDEVNLELLRSRLAEVHEEHLDRGCRSKPDFCIETVFDLTALYIQCKNCNTFEVVL